MNSLGLRCVSIATSSIYIVMALCMYGLFQVVKNITIFLLVTGLVIPSMPRYFFAEGTRLPYAIYMAFVLIA